MKTTIINWKDGTSSFEVGGEVKTISTQELVLNTVADYEERVGLHYDPSDYEYREGRGRYHKIVVEGHRAVAFYDTLTGNILKAASWSAPAKTRIA